MIAKMKNASIIMLDSDRNDNVRKLEKLGLLHVCIQPDPGADYAELKNQLSVLSGAVSLLPEEKKTGALKSASSSKNISLPTALEYSKRIIQRSNDLKQIIDKKKQLAKYIDEIKIWGDFLPHDITELQSSGITVKLGTIRINKKNEPPDNRNYIVLSQKKKLLYVAFLIRDREYTLPEAFSEYHIPEKSLGQYRKEFAVLEKEADKIERELQSLFSHRNFLADSLEYIEHRLEFVAVYNSMILNDSLAVISGFVPADKTSAIEEFCVHSGWAVLFEDPSPEDNVPTLVQNKKAIGIIKPVFSLMGTVPGYRENDISFMFLLFFSLFFAMIIGDGAYGMIILLASLIGIISKAARKQPVPDVLFLMLLMGFTTVIWGSVTGTWFGSERIVTLPWLRQFVIKSIYSFNPDSEANVKLFCFCIGTVHIAIAHIWNIIKGIRNKAGLKLLAQLGWLSLVLGLFYVVLNLVLDPSLYPVPSFALPMIGGGLGAVILFGSQDGNFWKGIARGFSGFITTVLDGIASFSDIISYIRLFAVGLASIEIAKSFNAMANAAGGALGNGTIWQILVSSVILLIGHGLNLGMGALSVLVHGARLNMLEFSGHLGMEWTGFEYKPFGRKKTN
ncbi:MAG: V-type ATP synthase subunit I [Spirochaetales bacterium]|nr:V-type ATP synthase subunit I [Spirochaetales bacterium]